MVSNELIFGHKKVEPFLQKLQFLEKAEKSVKIMHRKLLTYFFPTFFSKIKMVSNERIYGPNKVEPFLQKLQFLEKAEKSEKIIHNVKRTFNLFFHAFFS